MRNRGESAEVKIAGFRADDTVYEKKTIGRKTQMAKIIKKGRYVTLLESEESDAIYSEGWTIGSVTPLAKSNNGAVIRRKPNEKNSESEEPEKEE